MNDGEEISNPEASFGTTAIQFGWNRYSLRGPWLFWSRGTARREEFDQEDENAVSIFVIARDLRGRFKA
jgi:hypothetical protein